MKDKVGASKNGKERDTHTNREVVESLKRGQKGREVGFGEI